MSERDEVLGFPEDDRNSSNPPAPRMSGTAKFLMILGGIGGVIGLLCCGGIGYFAYNASRMMTDDPVKIRAAAAEIADLDFPPGFEPKMSMNAFGVMAFVIYTPNNDDKNGMLMLASFSNRFGNNAEQQCAGMRQQLDAQGHGNGNLRIIKSETKEFDVRGEKSEFEFAEAEDRKTHAKFRQVTGTFPAKTGIGMLMLIVPEEKYDEQAAVKLIKSIK